MIIIGIILGAFGIGFCYWALFALAVYALPVYASITAGLAAFHSGAGVIGAMVVAILVGFATLAAGRLAFAATRSPLVPWQTRPATARPCRRVRHSRC